jgi:hypothetical protein
MIASNIIGGLGNQMFQFACGYATASRLNQPLFVCLDQFERYKLHNGYELDNIFNVNAPELSCEARDELIGWRGEPNIRKVIAKLGFRAIMPENWFQESSLRYCEGINLIDGDCYLHGYWQSEKYFKDYADDIRQVFKFSHQITGKNLEVLSMMRQQPSISVHVRRGDYLSNKNNKIFNCLGVDYYLEGLQILMNRFPGSKIFLFSDDPEWVRTSLEPFIPDASIINHNFGENSYWDMMLMSSADHHIIANSSFSWWGAWLNPSKEKVVISPKEWYLNSPDKCSDLIPEDWVRI